MKLRKIVFEPMVGENITDCHYEAIASSVSYKANIEYTHNEMKYIVKYSELLNIPEEVEVK